MIAAKLLKAIKYPWLVINYLNGTVLRFILPDKLVIKCRFRSEFGRHLDLRNPTTFNEKLQWLKLFNRNPEFCKLVDKYEVKSIIGSIIGEEHIIPTYGVWDCVDKIDFGKLPDSFVMKATHDSHSIVMCDHKDELNIQQTKILLRKWLKHQYFYGGREWPYKLVKPRIIAEKNMAVDEAGLVDYKIHCFNGIPRFILTCSNRYTESGLIEIFYDLEWKRMPVHRPGNHTDEFDIPKPEKLNEMIQMAGMISKDIPFVRIDFYQIEHIIYFGEVTFFPASGYKRFIPEEYDKIFGGLIELQHRNALK